MIQEFSNDLLVQKMTKERIQCILRAHRYYCLIVDSLIHWSWLYLTFHTVCNQTLVIVPQSLDHFVVLNLEEAPEVHWMFVSVVIYQTNKSLLDSWIVCPALFLVQLFIKVNDSQSWTMQTWEYDETVHKRSISRSKNACCWSSMQILISFPKIRVWSGPLLPL